ncbi:MAG: DUF2461 domain-containing protein [Aureispira sp.]|nr:DUF2461 domain-containing protein [Aureispira sp.]
MLYFTEDYNNFFKGLARSNSKDWFDVNRKDYEKHVKKAFYKFLGDLIERIKKDYDPNFDLLVKNAVFRINRDIRFSKDKTPYKLHMGAVVSNGGRKNMQIPGMYIQLGVGELWLGGGMYSPSKDNLYKIREYLMQNPKSLDKILADKTFKKFYGELRGTKNKVLPKVFKEAAKEQPLIFNKQFYYMAEYDDESLITRDDFMDWVIEHYEASQKINKWFSEALN